MKESIADIRARIAVAWLVVELVIVFRVVEASKARIAEMKARTNGIPPAPHPEALSGPVQPR